MYVCMYDHRDTEDSIPNVTPTKPATKSSPAIQSTSSSYRHHINHNRSWSKTSKSTIDVPFTKFSGVNKDEFKNCRWPVVFF